MMRVGRRRVARAWTYVDAAAPASSVAMGRSVGRCGTVGCDEGVVPGQRGGGT